MTFRLVPGVAAPVQSTAVSCGSACLTVARMLADPTFARWITHGEGARVDAPEGASEAERFAAYERVVHRRTTALRPRDKTWNMPWPRSLGTPPWGARKELEAGASARGTRYSILPWRAGPQRADPGQLRTRYERLDLVVSATQPALLYVGNRLSPRHVTLVVPSRDGSALLVYDPHDGSVSPLTLARCRGPVQIAGWSEIWLSVQPTGHRLVRSSAPARRTETAPQPQAVAQLRSEERV